MSTTHFLLRRVTGLIGIILVFVCAVPQPASAAIRVRDICTILGQEETQLTGLGLVTGLEGTGDNKFNPTINALRTALGSLNDRDQRKNNIDPKGLLGSKNVALVIVSATIPAHGVKRGQKIDCTVFRNRFGKELEERSLDSHPVEQFQE